SLRFRVLGQKPIHELSASVVKTLRLASRMLSESIGCNDRQCYGRIKVAYNRIRQAIGIDFAPGDCLCRRGSRKSAGIRSRIRNLQEIVVTAFVYAQHFLDLRLRLQQKVFRRATAENEYSR